MAVFVGQDWRFRMHRTKTNYTISSYFKTSTLFSFYWTSSFVNNDRKKYLFWLPTKWLVLFKLQTYLPFLNSMECIPQEYFIAIKNPLIGCLLFWKISKKGNAMDQKVNTRVDKWVLRQTKEIPSWFLQHFEYFYVTIKKQVAFSKCFSYKNEVYNFMPNTHFPLTKYQLLSLEHWIVWNFWRLITFTTLSCLCLHRTCYFLWYARLLVVTIYS